MSPEAIQYVELSKLSLRPQVRERADDETIAGLAASIVAVGLLHPLRVRRDADRLIVVDGERRLRAVHSLGWKCVPVIVEERELCHADVVNRQLVANTQRRNLNAGEFSRALKEFIDATGYSVSEAAAACGYSPATVSRHLKLLETPCEVQAKLASGELSAAIGYEVAKVSDPAKQVELANEAVAKGLSREAVKQRAKAPTKRSDRKKPVPVPKIIADLGERRSVAVQGPGLLNLETLIAWLNETLEAFKRALDAGCDLSSLCQYVRAERQS